MERNKPKRKPYKFRLHYLMMRLPMQDYMECWEVIPKLLGVSRSTYKRWIFLPEDDHYDIPYSSMVKLANYFDVEPHEIYTNHEQIKPYL